ncbi:MAG TPA: ribonuclease P protein component [Candidatus Angelobacter sp.]|nr:ribonuclease P protein component [Candidatus Angelobacter sp.]
MNGNQTQSLQKFPKSSRLLRHTDFQAVYKEGRKHFSGNITVFYRRRSDNAGPRIGFTVGKVLGGAVERNRIRRRMRAAVQKHLSEILLPLDIVLHPRRSVLAMEFAHLDAEVGLALAAVQKGKTK